MAFESTNAILGVKSLEEQKKSNRWSKWMDIANLLQNTAGMGADIWKTISGRKYQTSEREAGQEFDKEMADRNLENEQTFHLFKNANPGKSEEQLRAEFYATPEGRAYLDDMARRSREEASFASGLRVKEERAGKATGLSENGWTAYEKAIEQARNQFYQLDEGGNVVLKPNVTQEQVKQFLYGFLSPAFVEEGDIPGLRGAFDMWLMSPDFPGGEVGKSGDNTADIVKALLEEFRGMAERNPPAMPARPEGITSGPGIVAGSTASPAGAAFGTAFLDQSNAERDLEEGLKSIMDNPMVSDVDKALAKEGYTKSKRIGYLSDEDYKTLLTVLNTLKAKYADTGKKLLK